MKDRDCKNCRHCKGIRGFMAECGYEKILDLFDEPVAMINETTRSHARVCEFYEGKEAEGE